VTTIDAATAPARIKAWLEAVRPAIEAELDRRLTFDLEDADALELVKAMRYAALGPGKRLRPAMVLAACEAVGGTRQSALPAAAAIESLHAYTLIHDDLPALDDDEERRGRPTVHVAFGESTAILAGDGLHTLAFGALADLGPAAADAAAVLARRVGAAELIAGQAMDLAQAARSGPISFAKLEAIHAGKTGALFAASAEIGAIAGGASAEERARLARYGMAVGVAFQHADDRDDAEFVEHAEAASARMKKLTAEAAEIAESFGERAAFLLDLATWIGSKA
jgi:geranylgeranyl pyrophosphate synthase